jgi:hypothetical protein
MKLAMVISQTNPEVVFNAFRLANFSRKERRRGEGVPPGGRGGTGPDRRPEIDTRGQAESFLQTGGQILA